MKASKELIDKAIKATEEVLESAGWGSEISSLNQKYGRQNNDNWEAETMDRLEKLKALRGK